METRPPAKRPVWPFILGAVLILLLIVIITRSCTRQYGGTSTMSGDTLNNPITTDSPMVDDGFDRADAAGKGDTDAMDAMEGTGDTAVNGGTDTVEDPEVPTGPPAMPATPSGSAVP